MAEIVNLRLARKRKARAAGEKAAQENRAKFGLSGAERRRRKAEAAKLERHLDGHLRGGDDG